MTLALARGQSPAGAAAATPSPIDYATIQVILSGDSSVAIAEKAAEVLPRANQSAWMRLERTFFIHFSVNTFGGVEWGSGREDPAIFNPACLDANQWVGAMKNAGGTMLVLVCKHHDGFCLWPTRYTSQSVTASPWRDGKGDLVREVANAVRTHGMKLAVYVSPADLYQLRTNPKNPAGYYGNGSSKVPSTIPTDPANFKTSPAVGRKAPAGFATYSYVVDDYNRCFLNQLYELLTEYGPISEVWFDGANPDPSVEETYDYAAWYDLIRRLQPEAVIFGKGPDARWVGNESGVGRTTEWSVIPLPRPPGAYTWPDMQDGDLGSRAKLTPGSYLWWYPAEVNAPILNGWFWSADKRPKSASQLIDIYYTSVGRNGNMLLNLSPDKRGLIPDDQLASLSQMAQVVNDTFAKDLAAGGTLTADTFNPAHPPSSAKDENLDTWWEAAPGRTNATVTLTLPAAVTFDVVSLQEAVDHRGQRIESFAVDTWSGSAWTTVDEQTTVGHKRLLRLASPVTTGQVRIRITGSRLEPTLAEVGLFKQALPVPAPTVSGRDAAGLAPVGWKVVDVDSQDVGKTSDAAANAIDGNPSTIWQTRPDAGLALPHYITVDMGRSHRIRGFTYFPRQDGSLEGVVEFYRFETSADGIHWTTNVDSGRFGNIRNNPALQEVTFPPVTARFFRFTALREINNNGRTSAAEISVLPADTGS